MKCNLFKAEKSKVTTSKVEKEEERERERVRKKVNREADSNWHI